MQRPGRSPGLDLEGYQNIARHAVSAEAAAEIVAETDEGDEAPAT